MPTSTPRCKRPRPSLDQTRLRSAVVSDSIESTDSSGSTMTTAQMTTALRDLISGSCSQDDIVGVDLSQANVPGFPADFALLPHQAVGKLWIEGRENPSKKRFGGILADDMGLGKTIQMLTRIVESRSAHGSDLNGWDGSTLIICPLALVSQWANEIQRMTTLQVLKHQGSNRATDPRELRKFDVVISTYDTVKSEYSVYFLNNQGSPNRRGKAEETDSDSDSDYTEDTPLGRKGKSAVQRSALFKIKWWRVVLDEAHAIRNSESKGATACFQLEGMFRWCMTGTPIQNSVGEIYSFVKFLRIKPLSDRAIFDNQISKPMQSGYGSSQAIKKLQLVLKQIMLRRLKDQIWQGKSLVELPKRTVNLIACKFDPIERAFYDLLESRMKKAVQKIMANNGGNYASVLLLLLRLRQACIHPSLVTGTDTGTSDNVNLDTDSNGLATAFGRMELVPVAKCSVCTSEASNRTKEDVIRTASDYVCADCEPLMATATSQLTVPESAKTRAIVSLLADISHRSNSTEKTIIFSQFRAMLLLIEPVLSAKGIKYVRYDGSMTTKEREVALGKIKFDPEITVILMSLKAGATGLNLTCCNNIIMVDLWWNPSLEDQAFDRAHRLGQTKDVNIYKLKVNNTVEDKILRLQEKKRSMAAATLSGDKVKGVKLRMDELLALFQPAEEDIPA